MKVKDIGFILKDGRRATLRSPRHEDAEGLIEYLRVSAEETEFLLRTPEECVKYTVEGEYKFIDSMNDADNMATLVCEVDGRIVGNCQITWPKHAKTKHRADIGIALISEFWGLGIGSAMFREMEKIAMANENIIQMELEFIEGNTRARALYEKMGFRITGMRPDAIRMRDGSLRNEYTMIKKIR
ncbi:MAG: GNAT family N-acetyltransferase [Clostridiales bacterium]|nr:GNAT family N-acetyltransferase [Clostridiales bacterium]